MVVHRKGCSGCVDPEQLISGRGRLLCPADCGKRGALPCRTRGQGHRPDRQARRTHADVGRTPGDARHARTGQHLRVTYSPNTTLGAIETMSRAMPMFLPVPRSAPTMFQIWPTEGASDSGRQSGNPVSSTNCVRVPTVGSRDQRSTRRASAIALTISPVHPDPTYHSVLPHRHRPPYWWWPEVHVCCQPLFQHVAAARSVAMTLVPTLDCTANDACIISKRLPTQHDTKREGEV